MQMTQVPPIWGRVTSRDLRNHFVVITGPRASLWYVIFLGMRLFRFDPNDPKYPQIWGQAIPNDLRNHFLGSPQLLTIFGGHLQMQLKKKHVNV